MIERINPFKISTFGHYSQAVKIDLPKFQVPNVDRYWGQIVASKAETIEVNVAGETKGLRGIDPQRDLMAGASVPNAARAFEFHDDWSIDLEATRYELEEVKRTSIDRALVRMVVTRGARLLGLFLRLRERGRRLRTLGDVPDHADHAAVRHRRDAVGVRPLVAAVDAGLACKATAGLHHAVRHRDPLTGFDHHGFLNLLLAVSRAVQRAPDADVVRVLAIDDAGSLVGAARAVTEPVARATRDVLVAYGSCSTADPVADLTALDLI